MRASCKESVGNILVADWLTQRHAPLQYLDRVGLLAAYNSLSICLQSSSAVGCTLCGCSLRTCGLPISVLRKSGCVDLLIPPTFSAVCLKIMRRFTPAKLFALCNVFMHMHLKSINTLFADLAHVPINDLDQSHDMLERRRPNSNGSTLYGT